MHAVAQIKSPSREAPAAPMAGWAEQGRSSSRLAETPPPSRRQVLDQMLFYPEQMQQYLGSQLKRGDWQPTDGSLWDCSEIPPHTVGYGHLQRDAETPSCSACF